MFSNIDISSGAPLGGTGIAQSDASIGGERAPRVQTLGGLSPPGRRADSPPGVLENRSPGHHSGGTREFTFQPVLRDVIY